jgi:hypothetical protein
MYIPWLDSYWCPPKNGCIKEVFKKSLNPPNNPNGLLFCWGGWGGYYLNVIPGNPKPKNMNVNMKIIM